MKKTIQIISTLFCIFTLPLLTSWLFDWWWISNNWTREALVTLIMLAQIVIGIFILRTLVSKKE